MGIFYGHDCVSGRSQNNCTFWVNLIDGSLSLCFNPLLPSIYKSVLHILKQYQNKPLLNDFEQRTIAALIKSCFEIIINLHRNKINFFSVPVKVRGLKNETAKQQPRALLRGQNRTGLGGKLKDKKSGDIR